MMRLAVINHNDLGQCILLRNPFICPTHVKSIGF